MKSRMKKVMKKNMQFMMPNAKAAFCIAHSFFILADSPLDPETPFVPTLMYVGPLLLMLEQLAPEMARSSYTPAMKAPTKQRSTKATNRVDLWVDLRRNRVRIAHTAARVETIKRVLQIRVLASVIESAAARDIEGLQDGGGSEPIRFLVDVDKPCLVRSAQV